MSLIPSNILRNKADRISRTHTLCIKEILNNKFSTTVTIYPMGESKQDIIIYILIDDNFSRLFVNTAKRFFIRAGLHY